MSVFLTCSWRLPVELLLTYIALGQGCKPALIVYVLQRHIRTYCFELFINPSRARVNASIYIHNTCLHRQVFVFDKVESSVRKSCWICPFNFSCFHVPGSYIIPSLVTYLGLHSNVSTDLDTSQGHFNFFLPSTPFKKSIVYLSGLKKR